MTALSIPFLQKDWEKLNRDAISGTLNQVLSGELSGITKASPRSRGGQIVHGMSSFVGFLCTFDVPLATQITLLGKWIKWGFDMSRPSYLKHVKDIIGEEEYLAYQKRAWMCQRFETIRFAKGLIDTEKMDEALVFLQERRVVGSFTNRFGNQIVEIEFEEVLEFIKIYDHRGFFTPKNIRGTVSFQKFQEKQSEYLKAMMSDLGKMGAKDFAAREKEFVKHALNGTGVLQNKKIDVDAIVDKAQKRALSTIRLPEHAVVEEDMGEEPKTSVKATQKHVVERPTPVTKPHAEKSAPVVHSSLYEEVQFNTVKKTPNGKSVQEPFYAFEKLEEALEEPFLSDIKENDLVMTYGLHGKFFAYRKNNEGELVMIDKVSMHPLMQADFDRIRCELKPSEIELILKKYGGTPET